jgi:hypothetical protein
MLDSLVRVSRRVGGAADLLATDMGAVQELHSLYEPPLLPAESEARDARLVGREAPELHPRPRSGPSGSSREPPEKCCHTVPLARRPSPRGSRTPRRREV